MKILAIIPARGGSKGVPFKNIRPLLGQPLMAYTIQAAKGAPSLDRVIVSTDDAEIANVAKGLGCEVMMRPDHLAQDGTPTLDVLQHVVAELEKNEGYVPDAVMTLQPTSPLRTAYHIEDAIAMFEADPQADSLVSFVEVPHIYHPLSVMKRDAQGYMVPYLDGPAPTRRQDKPAVFARNGAAVYITRRNRLKDYVFGGKLLAYLMDADSSVDIDTLDDFALAERLMAQRHKA